MLLRHAERHSFTPQSSLTPTYGYILHRTKTYRTDLGALRFRILRVRSPVARIGGGRGKSAPAAGHVLRVVESNSSVLLGCKSVPTDSPRT